MAMNEIDNLPKNAISRHESLRDIKAASETALAESREFHIFFGANPSEHHVVQLRAAEEKREREEGIRAPIRLFFVNAAEFYGIQTSSAKTPILNADFNKEESWDTILEALVLTGEPFKGVIDKIYFDVSTAKAARWGESILAKIAILLKESFELYIPDAKLESQSLFCDSEVDRATYQKLTKAEKGTLPFPPRNTQLSSPFFAGGCMAPMIKRDEIYYTYNSLGLVYDTTYSLSEIIGRPLTFESFESDMMYPNIGMEYRTEPEEAIQNYIRINSFIKITLEAEKKEAEEITFNIPTVIGTKENVIHEIGHEPSLIATSTEVTTEKDNVIHGTMLELPPKTATTEISIEKKCVINETVLELFPKEIPAKTSIREGYKEVKFPSLSQLKEALLQGRSTIHSETDSFYVQSFMGSFFGFRPEVKDFDLKMLCMSTFQDYKGHYTLSGMFRVLLENSNGIGIQIILKSYDTQESPYIVEGGAQKKDNFCFVSDPEELKIITPIKKREAEKTIFKALTVDETAKPVLPPKPTIIRSLAYCPKLYRKIKNNTEAIEKIYYDQSHNLQDRRSIDLLLEIRRELREAQDIIDTIEDPHTTTQDRALIAIFAPDRLEFMQRYMSAVERHPELSGWLQKIGFKW
jgi:hypothetical protein